MDVQEPTLFLRGRLDEGLYCGHKSKGYVMEVVTTAEKLPPDDKETGSRRQSQEGS